MLWHSLKLIFLGQLCIVRIVNELRGQAFKLRCRAWSGSGNMDDSSKIQTHGRYMELEPFALLHEQAYFSHLGMASA
jgi:hypothetical protein